MAIKKWVKGSFQERTKDLTKDFYFKGERLFYK